MRSFKPEFFATAVIVGGLASSPCLAAEPLNVVASFSILSDLVAEVGGGHVKITTLVGPNGDAHVYQPTPADARAMAGAGLVVVNGLGFEGWLERLVEASGYEGPIAIATEGVERIEMQEGQVEAHNAGVHAGEPAEEHLHGNTDPHAWQSIANAKIYVRNIADALCSADAENCGDYRANADAYNAELEALDASIKSTFAALPEERRKVITSHDAFGYFGHAYGIAFMAPQGVSTDAEASAADVAMLIEQIRSEGVTALFVENVSDPRLIEQIGRETGVRTGGALYSDALSEPDETAATYVQMMRHNATLLTSAMLGS